MSSIEVLFLVTEFQMVELGQEQKQVEVRQNVGPEDSDGENNDCMNLDILDPVYASMAVRGGAPPAQHVRSGLDVGEGGAQAQHVC